MKERWSYAVFPWYSGPCNQENFGLIVVISFTPIIWSLSRSWKDNLLGW